MRGLRGLPSRKSMEIALSMIVAKQGATVGRSTAAWLIGRPNSVVIRSGTLGVFGVIDVTSCTSQDQCKQFDGKRP